MCVCAREKVTDRKFAVSEYTDTGEWVYRYYITTPLTAEYNIEPINGAYFDGGLSYRRHVISNEDGVVFEVIPETVGQFTGWQDKDENGKDVYEGDILYYKDNDSRMKGEDYALLNNIQLSRIFPECFRFGVIIYSPPGFAFSYINTKTGYYDKTDGCDWSISYKSFVAGNIHDNPKLLTLNEL
jgi:hypothetical protein